MSFEQIYRQHWEAVYTVCYHYIQSKHLAEDFVQDIFQSLWERRKKLVIEVSIENYLMRAARYKVFEYLRTEALHRKHHEKLHFPASLASNATEDAILYNELSQTIERLAGNLSPQVKTVFELSRIAGMKNRQIADELELSEKTIKNHLTRALNSIRTALKEYEK